MEDAATAEIARAQLWQWLHHADPRGQEPRGPNLHLADGTEVDFVLFERALLNLSEKLGDRTKLPGGSRINEAIGMLDRLTHADTLEEFLTLPAYARLD
jgi:malate synthase